MPICIIYAGQADAWKSLWQSKDSTVGPLIHQNMLDARTNKKLQTSIFGCFIRVFPRLIELLRWKALDLILKTWVNPSSLSDQTAEEDFLEEWDWNSESIHAFKSLPRIFLSSQSSHFIWVFLVKLGGMVLESILKTCVNPSSDWQVPVAFAQKIWKYIN